MLGEQHLEDAAIGRFQQLGWHDASGPTIAPDGDQPARSDYRQVVPRERLRARFGARFDQLKHEERMALALAGSEGTVNHARLCTVSTVHPVELTRILQHLTQIGMLASAGSGRGVVYFLPGQEMPTPDDVFGPALMADVGSALPEGASSSVLPDSSSLLTSGRELLTFARQLLNFAATG